VLREQRPDIVITMNFDLTWGESGMVNHADHRAVGLAVLDAVRDAANPWVFTDAGPAWGGATEVYAAWRIPPTTWT
jgi:LmbE family N-acetylglucosaminyl deacetylase